MLRGAAVMTGAGVAAGAVARPARAGGGEDGRHGRISHPLRVSMSL